MMALVNDFYKKNAINKAEFKTLLALLNPVAPHMTEELWEMFGGEGFCSVAPWPVYDEAMCKDDELEIPVQINGKLRSRIVIPNGADQATALDIAKKALYLHSNILKKPYLFTINGNTIIIIAIYISVIFSKIFILFFCIYILLNHLCYLIYTTPYT